MKILQIISGLGGSGGAQNLLISFVKELNLRGHEVTVLQQVEPEEAIVCDKIIENGGTVFTIKKTGSIYNPLFILQMIPWLRQYDIVHVHLFPTFYWAGFASLLSRSNTPMIFTEHSTLNRRMTNPILRRVDSFVYNHCYDKVVACSEKASEQIGRVYPHLKKLCAINNGIDIDRFAQADSYIKEEWLGIPNDSFVVTMVARFAYPKRHDVLVRAIAQLPPYYHVVFAGSKPEGGNYPEVEKLVKDLKVEDRVHFLGVRADVPEILKSSDAVVLSSEYEGLSLSSIEAMASGTPFIASDVNGIREVVKGYGVLYGLEDYQGLSEILVHLHDDKRYNETISRQCVENANNYNVHLMTNRYLDVYREIINKRS